MQTRIQVICGSEKKFKFKIGEEVIELFLDVADNTIRGDVECHGY